MPDDPRAGHHSEADCPDSATADGRHCKCERSACCWCGTERPATVVPLADPELIAELDTLAAVMAEDEPTEADPPAALDAALIDSGLLEPHTLAGGRAAFLHQLATRGYEVRALVGGRSAPSEDRLSAEEGWSRLVALEEEGGRSAAPTRDEVAETIREVMRSYSGRIFAGTLLSDRVDYTRELTDAFMARLSRSAAEPPEDHEAQRRADVAESIYQRHADGWHAVMHEIIEPPCWNRSNPDDTEPLTADQVAWMRGEPLPGGVAAEPKETDSDG